MRDPSIYVEYAALLVKYNMLRKAAQFGLAVLRESRDELADIDGGWIQEQAEAIGLLQRVTVTEACGEDCKCAEYDDFPQNCLRMTDDTLALDAELAKERK